MSYSDNIELRQTFSTVTKLTADIDKLPLEILEKIFLKLAVQPPSELINLRVVCQKWNSIIKDENFLNKFFYYRLVSYSPLKFYRNSRCSAPCHSTSNTEKYSIPNLFRSSDTIFLEHEPNDADFHDHKITFLPSSFTISFWISFPNKADRWGVLAKSPTSNKCLCLFYDFGWHLWTVNKRYGNENNNYHLKIQEWIHIAVSLIDDETAFFYLNGEQYKFSQNWSFDGLQGETEDKISVKYWADNGYDVLCISDFRLISGYLTRLEIEAVSKQSPVPLDMIKVGTYWKNKIDSGERK